MADPARSDNILRLAPSADEIPLSAMADPARSGKIRLSTAGPTSSLEERHGVGATLSSSNQTPLAPMSSMNGTRLTTTISAETRGAELLT